MKYISPKIVEIDKDEFSEIKAIEHDTLTRFINFKFVARNVPVDLTDCKVRIYANNSQRNEVFNDLTVIDSKKGIAQLELTDALLKLGTSEYQLKIMPISGGRLSSNTMRIVVEKDLMTNNAIEGSNEFTALDNAIKQVDKLIKAGNSLNPTLADNVEAGTTLKKQLDTSIQTATTKNSELKVTTETANSSNTTLVRTTEQANAVKRELDQSISVGDIANLVNRVTLLEKKGIKTLWSGSIQNKNDTITLSEDLNNFDSLLISYSFAGHMQGIVDLKSQTGCKFITGNLLNDDSGKTYSILELELSKTSNTVLTITQNKELVNSTTVNLNVATITKIEGIKF